MNDEASNSNGTFAIVISRILLFAIAGALFTALGFAIAGAMVGLVKGFDLFNLVSLGDRIKEAALIGAMQGLKLGAIGGVILGTVSGLVEAEKIAKEKREADTEAKRKADAEARRKAITEEKRKTEAKAKREAEAEAKRKAKAEAKRIAKVEAENLVNIQANVKDAIRIASDAAILNARVVEYEDASANERLAARDVEDNWISSSNYDGGPSRRIAEEAVRIEAIEKAGNLAIDLAIQAAKLCTEVSAENSTSAIDEAREAAIKLSICSTSQESGNEDIAKTVSRIVDVRSQAMEDARKLAAASKGARIATRIDEDDIRKAFEEAHLVAVRAIIENASKFSSDLRHIVAIEAMMSVAIVDAIESAVRAATHARSQQPIQSVITDRLTTVMKEADTFARAGNLRARLNVPVHNYKDLPKLETPAGYIYVIKDVSRTQEFKIGRTNHPGTRINNFGVTLPFKTEVIAILKTDDTNALEEQLHRKFASQRKRGEWFDLTAEQVRQIQNM